MNRAGRLLRGTLLRRLRSRPRPAPAARHTRLGFSDLCLRLSGLLEFLNVF